MTSEKLNYLYFCDFVATIHWTFSAVQRDERPRTRCSQLITFLFLSVFVLLFIFVSSTSHAKEMTPTFLELHKKMDLQSYL